MINIICNDIKKAIDAKVYYNENQEKIDFMNISIIDK